MSNNPFVSIVVPVFNEAPNVAPLHDSLESVMNGRGYSHGWEVIYVDDGSTDGTADELERLANTKPNVNVILFRRNFGKSAALAAGFGHSRGDILVTIDGDLQDDPTEIPHLIAKLDEGFDLVSGWKKKRHDSIEKRIASRIFNAVVARATGLPLHDFNCGLKAYRSWCLRDLRLSGNLYRFLPAFVAQRGGRVTEIPVTHHARLRGKSKYGWRRYFQGFFDLFTLTLLVNFFQKPLYFFGIIGTPLLALGSVLGSYLLYRHILYLLTGDLAYQLNTRPLLSISITLFGLGLQIVLVGLLAELVLYSSSAASGYSIRKVVSANRDKRE